MPKITTKVLPSTDPENIIPDEKNINLYYKIMGLIGEVTTEWAMLDHDLIDVLSALAKCPIHSAGIIYFSINSLSSRIAILKGLAKHAVIEDASRNALLKVLTKILRYATARNEIVHSAYVLTIANSDGVKKLRNKQVIQRHTFRSERNQLHSVVRAQTGELKNNIKNVDDVRKRLKIFNLSYRMPSSSSVRKPSPKRLA